MNGNALGADGRLVHCEHGRRCISRSNSDGAVEPIVTHFETLLHGSLRPRLR